MTVRLLRGLASEVLPCGCLVGVYETYSGAVVRSIDSRGAICSLPQHSVHAVLPDPPTPPAAGTDGDQTAVPRARGRPEREMG